MLYCQPILALRGAENYPMAEILVRMREEERALLPPGEFLPVFEHYRMMPQLDRWVVRHAVAQLARGSDPCFTVNLSGQTLEDLEFPPFVAGELSSRRVAPASLLFEIGESDMLERLDAAERFATGIRAIGSGMLIDGFGRSSVAFAPLKALRPQFVKVDGGIVRNLPGSEVARIKMKAILRVCEGLGSGVVAECVEGPEVLLSLKALGGGYAQGFGIRKPRPV